MREVDVIIVGGGPAGSTCARELIRQGRECLVLERKPMPRVKLCAGWITPRVLSDLQFHPEEYPHGLVRLNSLKVYFGKQHRWSRTVGCEQYSIRRVEFDAWLLQRTGVEVLEHTVRTIKPDGEGYLIDEQFRCRHLVGAGGSHCPVKKTFFGEDTGKLVVAQEIEYPTTPKSSVCTLWFPYAGSWGYAWFVPKTNAVNVGFGGLRSQLLNWDRQKLWRTFVGLLLQEGCIAENPPEPKGYSYFLGQRDKKVKDGNAYIIGDAAGLATVDLAEGIGPAVESGILAARDILGQGTYTTRTITRYSLPFVSRSLRNMASLIP